MSADCYACARGTCKVHNDDTALVDVALASVHVTELRPHFDVLFARGCLSCEVRAVESGTLIIPHGRLWRESTLLTNVFFVQGIYGVYETAP